MNEIIKTKKPSPENIAAVKAIVAQLKAKHEAARASLLRDELETLKWKDQLYYDTLDAIEPEPLFTGLRGVMKIRSDPDWGNDIEAADQ